MKIRFIPYNMGSASCKALSAAVGAKMLKPMGRYRPTRNCVVVNWGCTDTHYVQDKMGDSFYNLNCHVEYRGNNEVLCTRLAANKLFAFSCMDADMCVPWTDDADVARSWIDDGSMVVCRTSLAGHSGEGIVLAKTPEELVRCSLYTKYIKKTHEYRAHVFRGQVIDLQRKMRNKDIQEPNWHIRNHANGFIYGREGVELSEEIAVLARKACEQLKLDFGAVDIIYNNKYDKYYVLEVNTACGLEGTTLDKYTNSILEYVRGL